MTVDEGISMDSGVPVVVVGAGPAGLAAAAHLVERGLDPVVLEAGDQVGAAVRQWRHVRLFSPWGELIDDAAARLLESAGWARPDPASYPTGEDWAERYLEPLAKTLGERVRLGTRVVGVARRGRDRIVDAGRESEPLTVHTLGADGIEGRITARAVIDASGTWGTPNPLGGDGLPAIGEHAAADRITYRVPDLADERVASRYRGRHVAVVGSGHSALTALVTLTSLSPDSSTHVTWVLRRSQVGNVFGGGQADALAARGALGQRARAAVDDGNVDVRNPVTTSSGGTAPSRWCPMTIGGWTTSTRSSPSPGSAPTSHGCRRSGWTSTLHYRHRSPWRLSSTRTCTPVAPSRRTAPPNSPIRTRASTWSA
jgi:cation diffusion facilitator CzcD-associated flavoprotein CzcO